MTATPETIVAATMFSGIGAPECAMPHWDWRWCAEIEKFPSAVLHARHPLSINLGDINAEDFVARAEKRGRPDVIVFGSPCQDFSVAGSRVGLDGNRGNLALVALGVVNCIRPRWVVFENVPGLLSSRSGSAEAERAVREGPVGGRADGDEDSDFAAFLSLVRECGYLGGYRITDAQYAGVPQRRRRIFAVFHLGDWRPAAAVLFEPDGLRGDPPPCREEGKRFTEPVGARSSTGGRLGTDFDIDGGFIAKALKGNSGGIDREDGHTLLVSQIPVDVPDVAWALQERDSKGTDSDTKEGHLITTAIGFNGRQDPVPSDEITDPIDTDSYTQVIAFDTTQITSQTNRSKPEPGNACHALAAEGHPPVIAFSSKDYGGDAAIEQSPTLRAMGFDGSHANGGGQIAVAINLRGREGGAMPELSDAASLRSASGGSSRSYVFKPSHFTRGKDGAPSGVAPPLGAEPDKGDQDAVLMTGTAVRRLTPMECERLQAFPDSYTDIIYRGKPASDGPRYKALGNAMNVKEVQWVLRRIELFQREESKWSNACA